MQWTVCTGGCQCCSSRSSSRRRFAVPRAMWGTAGFVSAVEEEEATAGKMKLGLRTAAVLAVGLVGIRQDRGEQFVRGLLSSGKDGG